MPAIKMKHNIRILLIGILLFV